MGKAGGRQCADSEKFIRKKVKIISAALFVVLREGI